MKSIPTADLQAMFRAHKGNWIAFNLVEIAHPDKPTPLRFVGARENKVHNGNTYESRAIVIPHPKQSRSDFGGSDLTIDNRDRALSFFARQYSYLKRATLTLKMVSNTDLDDVLIGPYEFVIKQVGLSDATHDAVITLAYEDTLNENYPFGTYDEHYAALYGVEAG